MTRKRIFQLLCILLLSTLLFSCGSNGNPTATTETNSAEVPSSAPAEEQTAPPTVTPTEAETVPVKPLGKNIACVGDSITYGAGSTNYNEKSYPSVLQTLLGSSYTVTNYGFSGASYVETTRNYIPYDGCGKYRMSLAAKPDTIVIILGTNDTHDWAKAKGTFEAQVRSLIAAYQELDSDPSIYLCSPIRRYDSATYNNCIQNELMPILEQVAKDTGCVYVDLFSQTNGIQSLYTDNLHMNDEGYAFLAQLVYAFLSEAIPSA